MRIQIRDTQRKKLYNAERKHHLWSEKPFETFEQVKEYAAFVMEQLRQKDFNLASRNNYTSDDRNPVVVKSSGTGRAYATRRNHRTGSIHMPKWSWTRQVIIHELAHLVAGLHHAHNHEYARVYIHMMRIAIGDAEANELASCFNAGRVQYMPNRSEQRLFWKAAAAQRPKLKPRERFLNTKLNELVRLVNQVESTELTHQKMFELINSLRIEKEA